MTVNRTMLWFIGWGSATEPRRLDSQVLISDSVSPSTSFFKIAFSILGPLHFWINFELPCLLPHRVLQPFCLWLHWIYIQITLAIINSLSILSLPILNMVYSSTYFVLKNLHFVVFSVGTEVFISQSLCCTPETNRMKYFKYV